MLSLHHTLVFIRQCNSLSPVVSFTSVFFNTKTISIRTKKSLCKSPSQRYGNFVNRMISRPAGKKTSRWRLAICSSTVRPQIGKRSDGGPNEGPIFSLYFSFVVNPLSAKPTKWSNTLKQFVGYCRRIVLSLFDHFMGLALEELRENSLTLNRLILPGCIS